MTMDETLNTRGVPAQVTIAIPTLNRPESFERALRSALAQAGEAVRIVVSENASAPEFAARYAALFATLPASVRVVRHVHRVPVEQHLPLLIGLVDTRFVVLLADDDVLAPDFVTRALALATVHGHVAVFGPYRHDWQATGASKIRSFDYTQPITFVRMLRFISRRNDSFIYGLHATPVLARGLREFQPLVVLGRRTLTRIAYAPLFTCLLAGSYGHLHGAPVWVGAVDSDKTESYLGASNVRKLVVLVLGEAVLAARFIRIAARDKGVAFALALAPFVAVMAVVEALGFVALAARRVAAFAVAGAQRRAER